MDNTDIYTRVTKQVIDAIEAGKDRYRMPWHVTATDYFCPTNALSKRQYRGINLLALWAVAEVRGYTSGFWATYKQWQQLGAQVRRGEKASEVVLWKPTGERSNELHDGDETVETRRTNGLIARSYFVFNSAQVDGFTPEEFPRLSEQERINAAEQFFAAVGADIRHGGAKAFYDVAGDFIQMPDFERFRSANYYYSTLGHETVHNAASRIMPSRPHSQRTTLAKGVQQPA